MRSPRLLVSTSLNGTKLGRTYLQKILRSVGMLLKVLDQVSVTIITVISTVKLAKKIHFFPDFSLHFFCICCFFGGALMQNRMINTSICSFYRSKNSILGLKKLDKSLTREKIIQNFILYERYPDNIWRLTSVFRPLKLSQPTSSISEIFVVYQKF